MQKGAVQLQYISTDEKIVDILTKPLSILKFVYFRDKLGLMENAFLGEREWYHVDVSPGCSIGHTFYQIGHVV